MGKPTGFLDYKRKSNPYRPTAERIHDWRNVNSELPVEEIRIQAARCMDCGVPFCNQGCPLGNIIPDWNDLVYRNQWKEAFARLSSTNNFPEFTGLVCPAPCEAACVLDINNDPVTIKQVEWRIAKSAIDNGWLVPIRPTKQTGKSVAIVGSGPAGLACAQQLGRAGHTVTVFEKADRIGGLLRYGIPDFKLEKWLIDQRFDQLQQEGVQFQTGVHVGIDLSIDQLQKFDALVLACGSEKPRDLPIPGRDLRGIHFAMDFLTQQNRRVSGLSVSPEKSILATDKDVVVIGGGDTGSDCIGTAHRQGARSVTSLELLPRPPDHRDPTTPWPLWPLIYRSSSSHQEGGKRDFAVVTQSFSGENGMVGFLHGVRVDWVSQNGKSDMREIPGSQFSIKADLVLLAMGFVHPVHDGLVKALGIELDPRGNIKADLNNFQTSLPSVFAAGDGRRGQSLVVWAIWEGREAACHVDQFLLGRSRLPSRDAHV